MQYAPVNPKYTQYLEDEAAGRIHTVTRDGHGLGYIPSPYSLEHLAGKSIIPRGARLQSYTRKYDLRTLGKVSPVKDQGDCGACWAFASLAALESVLLPAELRDFSENNLKNMLGSRHCGGGFLTTSRDYFAAWHGPVNETDDPYNVNSYVSPPGLTTQKHVLEGFTIPNRSGPLDNDNLKWAISNFGGVVIAFSFSIAAMNDTYHTYYFAPGMYVDGGHAIELVGWDDDFDKNKFNVPPPGNGAFILKNSWSADWGENGYYYASYYDRALGYDSAMVFNVAESSWTKTGIYQYEDRLITSIGYDSTTGWMANIFTSTRTESLSAVGFYTNDIDTAYEASVYLNVGIGPASGTAASFSSGTLHFPGYHVVSLPQPVALSSGTKFSTVVKLINPSYKMPIGLGTGVRAAGLSFTSADGVGWTDISDSTGTNYAALKALTADSPAPALSAVVPGVCADSVTVAVEIDGANFLPGASARLIRQSQPDINGTDLTVVNSGKITCKFNLVDAATGTWTVSVVNTDASSATLVNGFVVTPSPPGVSYFTPDTAANTASAPVTIKGGYFGAGAAVSLRRAGKADIAATGVTVVSSDTINCVLPITGADGGYWHVAVTNPDGQLGLSTGTFAVATPNPQPTLTAVTPVSVYNNNYVTVDITGSNFMPGATVVMSSFSVGLPVSSVTFIDSGHLSAMVLTDYRSSSTFMASVINPDGWDAPLADAFTVQKSWISAGTTVVERENPGIVLLPSGKVLVAGGEQDGVDIRSSEIYDPDTGLWSASGDMLYGGEISTLVLLPDGKVFAPERAIGPAEIYDPGTGLWTAALGRMKFYAYTKKIIALADGRVLACGGEDADNNADAHAEIYDPASRLWVSAGNIKKERVSPAVVLLNDGRVLVAGGWDPMAKTAEIFNPADNSWTAVPDMTSGHAFPNAVLLHNGKAMVVEDKISQIFDPSTGLWEPEVALRAEIAQPGSMVLPDGRVMAHSRYDNQMFYPEESSWHYADDFNTYHYYNSMAVLKNGRVLVAAKSDDGQFPAEQFVIRFREGTPVPAAVSPRTGINNASVSVTVSGTGFAAGIQVKLVHAGYADIAAENITVISSGSFTCTLPVTGASAGHWDLVVTSTDGKSAYLPMAFTVSYAAPAASAVTPATAENGGNVYISNLAGSGFKAHSAIKFVRSGYTTLSCTATVVNAGQLACNFPSWNAAPGVWDVQAENIDGKTATLSAAFTVTASAPELTSVTPSVIYSSGGVVTVALGGDKFLSGSTVTLVRAGQTAITNTVFTAQSPSVSAASFDITNAAAGVWDVVLLSPYGSSATLAGALMVNAETGTVITPNNNSVTTYNGPSGPIKVEVPAGAFGENVAMVISSPAYVPPAGGSLRAANVAMEISLDKPLQPQRPVGLTLSYLPADVAGLQAERLIIARYDTARSVWVPLTGCSTDTVLRKVVCQTNHFSLFQIMQASPASDLDNMKYYPNPLRPANGPLYEKINFTDMPSYTTIKVLTILGELVRTIYADANGMAVWDGKDGSGTNAASGTYIVRLEGGGSNKIIKVAVQR